MKIFKQKSLRDIANDRQETQEVQLADIYEILINIDDRLSTVEEKIGGEK